MRRSTARSWLPYMCFADWPPDKSSANRSFPGQPGKRVVERRFHTLGLPSASTSL